MKRENHLKFKDAYDGTISHQRKDIVEDAHVIAREGRLDLLEICAPPRTRACREKWGGSAAPPRGWDTGTVMTSLPPPECEDSP